MRRPPPPVDRAPAALDDETLADTLDSLDGAANYRDWIVSLFAPAIEAPILEVGAGRGTFTGALAAFGAVHAVEPVAGAVAILQETFADDPRVSVTHGVVEDLPDEPRYAAAVLSNVLEHIEDDEAALRAIGRRLLPGGAVCLFVPAFPLLYSRFDALVGHHRRYRRSGLVALVERAGFRVEQARYVNAPGWVSWLVMARLLGRIPTGRATVMLFDRGLVPVVRLVESRLTPPFGQSILVVARRPDAPAG